LLVIDPRDRLLLMCWRHAVVRSPSGEVWITPGGGVDAGETYEQAALRELREETGITDVPLGPCVWTREHTFDFNSVKLRQVERFYVVRIGDVPLTRDGWTNTEHESITDVRWWTVDEIAASDAWFAPRNLAALLPPVIAGQCGDEPIDAGV
jgi:8-oxo-dGTP pyrophosphatase MutT (NUDIX family)